MFSSVLIDMKKLTDRDYFVPVKVTFWRKLFQLIFKPILYIFANIQVENPEIIPEKGAFILAANHLSFYDGFVLQAAIRRPLFFMGKAEVFFNPVIRFFLRQVGAFPVQRGIFDRRALQQACRVLVGGMVLSMFPEGTRTYGKGMVSAKSGTAYLALQAKCPVVPVAITGSQYILKSLPKRAFVSVKICNPIYPDEKMDATFLTKRIMQSLAKNLPEDLRGRYS